MHRCSWVNLQNEEYVRYHDEEWGVKVTDDNKLFAALMLEIFAAGLSWQCVLKKRKDFYEAFDNFEVQKVAAYAKSKTESLLQNAAIVRHRGKINAATDNARAFLQIQKEHGSFYEYVQSRIKAKKIDNEKSTDVLTITKDLKNKNMKFLGATTVYSFLCATGFVNAHQKDCFCYKKLKEGQK